MAELHVFDADFGSSGQYGRDFYEAEVGFGRVEMAVSNEPNLEVAFLDKQGWPDQLCEADDREKLVHQINDPAKFRALVEASISLQKLIDQGIIK